jgi:hypothetical protein
MPVPFVLFVVACRVTFKLKIFFISSVDLKEAFWKYEKLKRKFVQWNEKKNFFKKS